MPFRQCLIQFVNHEARAQFRLKPCGFRRHDVSRVCNSHNLLHRYGVESQSQLHLAAIYAPLEFAKAAQTAHKVNAFVAAQVLDAEQLVENQT